MKRHGYFAAVAPLALLLLGAATNRPLDAPAATKALLESLAPVLADCNADCNETCIVTTEHKIPEEVSPDPEFSGPDHACQAGGSCSYHACGGGEDDLDALASLIPKLDGSELAGLSMDEPSLRIDKERKVVHVLGCADQVMLMVPMTSQQTGQLGLQ